MLNINPKEMLCAFPAGVVECQCPCYTASSSERLGVCSQDTLLLMPPSSYSSIRLKKKKRERRKAETSIFPHWKIETVNKRANLICSCEKSDSRLRFIQDTRTPPPPLPKTRILGNYNIIYVACGTNTTVDIFSS